MGFLHSGDHPVQALRRADHLQADLVGPFQLAHLPQEGVRALLRLEGALAGGGEGAGGIVPQLAGAGLGHGVPDGLGVGGGDEGDDLAVGGTAHRFQALHLGQADALSQTVVDAAGGDIQVGVGADDSDAGGSRLEDGRAGGDPLDGVEDDGVMGEDQLGFQVLRLGDGAAGAVQRQ